MSERLLIAGVPRSGSSWLATAFASTPNTSMVSEPDNIYTTPYALRVKRSLGEYPFVELGVVDKGFSRLWDTAFEPSYGHRPFASFRSRLAAKSHYSMSPSELVGVFDGRVPIRARIAMAVALPDRPDCNRVVVKSVHATLSLEWIAERTGAAVILLQRNPMAVIGSWVRMGWMEHTGWWVPHSISMSVVDSASDVPTVECSLSPFEWICWNMCTLAAYQELLASRHPEWQRIEHEKLSADGVEAFKLLARSVDWPWSDAIGKFVEGSNRPGSGYDTNRVASDAVDSWRDVLSTRQRLLAATIMRQFPSLSRWH